jgi:hypothetical protein
MYPATLPASKELLGAPEWHPFEHAVWPIAELLVPFLSGPDVDGQVLYTLLTMKASGFAREAEPLIQTKTGSGA